MAMEALRQQSQRRGEEDGPADALAASGQDQHDRRLGHPAEQRTEREDDEADGEQQPSSVTVGQGSGGEQHGRQRQCVGVHDPLQVTEARVQA